MKWIAQNILPTIILAMILYFLAQKTGLINHQVVTVVKKDTIIVTKIDTVIKEKIKVKKIKIPIVKKDTIKDTVYVLLDSTYYSVANFETKFEKIRIGAYAKSPVDSFTFTNFPKPVIYTDTITIKQKPKLKEKLIWGLIGVSVGVILAK